MSATENIKKKNIIFVVALALQRSSDFKYLMARRGPGQSGAGQWEFPGGKIELNETETQALAREIKEELAFDLKEEKLTFVAENRHEYETKIVQIKLYKSLIEDLVEFKLTEHDAIEWVAVADMIDKNISPADLVFIKFL